MGHSWREMDPQGAAEHDARLTRRTKNYKAIQKLPLSDLTLGELLTLIERGARHYDLDDDMLQVLASRMKQIKR